MRAPVLSSVSSSGSFSIMSTGSAPISGLAAFALLLRLLAPAAASPSERFLQSAPTVKALPTAEDFIRQLSFAVDDARYCNRTEEYEVGSGVYGLIRGPVSEDNPYLYPSDKAVTWLSDSAALSGWVNDPQLCCNAGQGSGALTDCMCAVAKDNEISRINGRYELVAVDAATAKVTPVSPTWRDPQFHEAFAQTYAWVFHSVSLVIPMQDPSEIQVSAPKHWGSGSARWQPHSAAPCVDLVPLGLTCSPSEAVFRFLGGE